MSEPEAPEQLDASEHSGQVRDGSTSTAAKILAEYGPSAGLAGAIEPFAGGDRERSLAERLAAHPLIMAPMASVTDASYRIMTRAGGADLAYSEMISCAGLHYGSARTQSLVEPDPDEPDVAVQLFGSKPELFREATESVVERLGERLVLIDINMACPVPKVIRRGEGAALMDTPELAEDIVRACIDGASGVPVTCKIRRGWYDGKETAPEFATRLEAAGACAVAVHGRYAPQYYHGEADWGCISRVVEAVSIPVIGSGDVMAAHDVVRMRAETGVTAVMVARGTYGNPWIFDDARRVMAGEEPRAHTTLERVRAFALHVRLLEAVGTSLKRARMLAGWYFKGMYDASSWRAAAMECSTVQEFLDLTAALEEELVRAGAAGEAGNGC